MNPIDAAAELPGWMERDDLERLAEWASQCLRVVEVGVYAGRSTTALAGSLPVGGRLYAVDDFRGEPDRPDLTGDALRDAFLTNCAPLLDSGRLVVMDMPSVDAAAALAEVPPLDFVFIDASHDYQSVCADIDAWLPLIRAGGLLAGDDAWQEGVRQALDALLPGRWQSVTNHLWSYEVPA